MDSISYYIHYPFCVRKCSYCDFVSAPPRDAAESARYLAAALREIDLRAPAAPCTVPSIFFGGGTPSLMSPRDIATFIDRIAARHTLSPSCEITVECNPASQPDFPSWARAVRAAGVNRLTIGVQSFDDDQLAMLGRPCDAHAATAAIDAALDTGFASVGLDLIYGLPGQSHESWLATIARATASGVQHISLYCLELHDGTPLHSRVATGSLPAPDPDLQSAMYHSAREYLASAGLAMYEFSNFSRPGAQSVHNQVYWHGGQYIGIGPAAASFLGGERSVNTSDMDTYITFITAGLPPAASAERLSSPRRAAELAIMALRTTGGFAPSDLAGRFTPATIAALTSRLATLASRAMLSLSPGGAFTVPPQYIFVSDAIFCEIIP